MVRISKKPDPKKIEELKKKVKDKQYMDDAVRRIAQILTEEIINPNGESTW
jgi:energy-converting hydrogenase A subunit M